MYLNNAYFGNGYGALKMQVRNILVYQLQLTLDQAATLAGDAQGTRIVQSIKFCWNFDQP